jgi:hypothetical protein
MVRVMLVMDDETFTMSELANNYLAYFALHIFAEMKFLANVAGHILKCQSSQHSISPYL